MSHVQARTILLVDDEESVRTLVRMVLEEDGHIVVEAANGAEALEKYESAPIHLLVTDSGVPPLSGGQLAEELARTRPALRVLFISGWMQKPATIQGLTQSQVCLLQKPFPLEGLQQKVRELLDQAIASSGEGVAKEV
jgi:DNA-binding NtrC family response regulator